MFGNTRLPLIPLVLFAFALALTSCQNGKAVTQTAALPPTQILPPTETSLPPTPTVPPAPLALKVNGEWVLLAEYDANLKQLQDAQKNLGMQSTPADQHKQVMGQLIDEMLLSQEARKAGHAVDDAALKLRVEALTAKLGGEAALKDWQTRMGYSDEAFNASLRRSAEAAWQRDQIMASVPVQAQQVHARQILVLSEAAANQVLTQLKQAGADFATIAFGYDLSTGGDLGWFPRGYLTQPLVEEAAFALKDGEVSAVIKSDLGYHIVQVIAHDDQRTLSPDALQVLQRKALEQWLEKHRAVSQIEELVP